MDRKRRRSNSPNNSNSSSKVFLPIELITEILSLLSVKAILRFKCVSKSWNILTMESNFVDKHLKVSSQNPHLTLSWYETKLNVKNIVPVPVHWLLKTQSATDYSEEFHHIEKYCKFVGSCNGLFCFVFCSLWKRDEDFNYWLCFSNPATRTRSEKFKFSFGYYYDFKFGYDAATRTYKVVALCEENREFKIFSLGDKCWRNIQNFPMGPPSRIKFNNGVHFYGTINWLATEKSISHIEQVVIVSLDLSTETYKQFSLPLGFDEVPFSWPVLRVLMDCFCFSYNSNKTEFILWKMKVYGVQESWIQLFKISYQNLSMQLQIPYVYLPMHIYDYSFHCQFVCLYVNGDIVIFASRHCKQSFIYNLKEKTVDKIKSEKTIQWFRDSKDYVESLASVH